MSEEDYDVVLVPFDGISRQLLAGLVQAFESQSLDLELSSVPKITVIPDLEKVEELGINAEVYRRQMEGISRKRVNGEHTYVIGVTDARLVGDLFIDAWDQTAIISTYGWTELYAPPSLFAYLIFTITSAILHAFAGVDFDAHLETKGCIFDYCSRREDIYVGMNPARTHICEDCLLQFREYRVPEVVIENCSRLVTWYKDFVVAESLRQRKRCFVLMPFREPFNVAFGYWRKRIRDSELGSYLDIVRADDISVPGVIYEDIVHQIKESNIILADVTRAGGEWNRNVCYELGYADALGKECIILAQDAKDLFFDKQHFRAIIYSTTAEGLEKLVSDLSRWFRTMLRFGINRSTRQDIQHIAPADG